MLCWEKVPFLRSPVVRTMLPDDVWHAARIEKAHHWKMAVEVKLMCFCSRMGKCSGFLLIPVFSGRNEVRCSGVHWVPAVRFPEQLLSGELSAVPAAPPVHFLQVVGKMRRNVRKTAV